jgi:hypothetical protein
VGIVFHRRSLVRSVGRRRKEVEEENGKRKSEKGGNKVANNDITDKERSLIKHNFLKYYLTIFWECYQTTHRKSSRILVQIPQGILLHEKEDISRSVALCCKMLQGRNE